MRHKRHTLPGTNQSGPQLSGQPSVFKEWAKKTVGWQCDFRLVREWSLITGKGRGGGHKTGGGGGASEVLPLQKKRGGTEKVVVMLKAQQVLR